MLELEKLLAQWVRNHCELSQPGNQE